MWDLKENDKKEEEQPLYPLYETEGNRTEYVLRCGRDTDRKKRSIGNKTEEEWEEVVQICRENKRKREKRRDKI